MVPQYFENKYGQFSDIFGESLLNTEWHDIIPQNSDSNSSITTFPSSVTIPFLTTPNAPITYSSNKDNIDGEQTGKELDKSFKIAVIILSVFIVVLLIGLVVFYCITKDTVPENIGIRPESQI